MDEQHFKHLADDTFKRILDAFDQVDPEDADADTAGNTINIVYRGGKRCVINTQTAVRQIWLAGAGGGWHFSYDEGSAKWLHDKATGDELFAVLARVTREAIGKSPEFP
jgi:CyaY protein